MRSFNMRTDDYQTLSAGGDGYLGPQILSFLEGENQQDMDNRAKTEVQSHERCVCDGKHKQ